MSDDPRSPAAAPSGTAGSASEAVGPLPAFLGPLVAAVARIRATVHSKLLAGFLVISLLLLGMSIFSILVINRMNAQVDALTNQQTQTDLARQMIYSVTAQSHFRAMALITRDPFWNDKITTAKTSFSQKLAELEAMAGPSQQPFIEQLREIDQRFSVSSDQVLAAYQAGDLDRALDLHISQEHEISHEHEDALNAFIGRSAAVMAAEESEFKSDRRFLTFAVATFSGASLVAALLLGAILSWSLIQPVRKIDHALALIAGGDFQQRVEVENRDEFGSLTANLNRTTGQLSELYANLRSLNEDLANKVEEQVAELERVARLRRYVAPQVADAVLGGNAEISMVSTRRNLTIFFSDIRGFTEMSEWMEPEELVDALNAYLTKMTEVVFKYEGTLDKYLGDGIMVFFGDPIPFEDHAQRAVNMAFEMGHALEDLQQHWSAQYRETLAVGMGISTGYVTVGNVGSPARSEYTVVGNHVNVASRLSERAGPGQVLVSERTLAAVRDRVEATEIEQISLKGVQRPIRVYEIRERPEA
ncbi:MAG: HAMP domain-containing protein [Actinomycetota bacterium]|nr:HAMP domain-containing protein [Actinomycetota bacterium]